MLGYLAIEEGEGGCCQQTTPIVLKLVALEARV